MVTQYAMMPGETATVSLNNVQFDFIRWKSNPNYPQGREILPHNAGNHNEFISTWPDTISLVL